MHRSVGVDPGVVQRAGVVTRRSVEAVVQTSVVVTRGAAGEHGDRFVSLLTGLLRGSALAEAGLCRLDTSESHG